MRNFLYFNQDGTLRCKTRDITTETFTRFDDSILKLSTGKYIVYISIHADVDESFYTAIDESDEWFTDSPFYITITIGENVQTYHLCQYTPIDIQLTKVLDIQEDTNIVIQSNYTKYTAVKIDTVVEKL